MKPIILILMLSLVVSMGCAKPDWIQETLVTVDVTGVWVGSINYTGGGLPIRLELEQHGPKVSGSLRVLSAGTSGPTGTLGSGPVEGTVAGDVLSLRRTNGSFSAELRVNEDEMATSITSNRSISLRRVTSSPRPTSQP